MKRSHSRMYQALTMEKPSIAEYFKDASVVGCVMSGLLFGLLLLALLAPESGFLKVRKVLKYQHALEQEIQTLQAENAQLIRDLEAMHTDPFWQEKIAREELNLARPGEIIYKFIE